MELTLKILAIAVVMIYTATPFTIAISFFDIEIYPMYFSISLLRVELDAGCWIGNLLYIAYNDGKIDLDLLYLNPSRLEDINFDDLDI